MDDARVHNSRPEQPTNLRKGSQRIAEKIKVTLARLDADG